MFSQVLRNELSFCNYFFVGDFWDFQKKGQTSGPFIGISKNMSLFRRGWTVGFEKHQTKRVVNGLWCRAG